MEHLDLAGMVTSSHNWSLPTFEQQDAIYLSNSRQMLEPILEETSEDEEHSHSSSWSQYDQHFGFYSSAESETGSVIRVENNKDADAISERDFACPAKRARRAQEFPTSNSSQMQSVDDHVILRHYPKNSSADNIFMENSQTYESITRDSRDLPNQMPMQMQMQQRNSTGNRRFDEFFSDSDSLSFNSLSRSSSLIQFESLERQLLLQDQHVSSNSLGASSPSLLSFDGCGNNKQTLNNEEGTRSGGNSGNSSRRGSQISLLRRFESSDGRLHQTYCQLDKLNFDDELDCSQPQFLANSTLKTDDSTYLVDNSSLNNSKTSEFTDTVEGGRGNKRSMAKNSTENLSEDSGYCEPSPQRSGMQQKTFEKFSEEEEECNAAFIDEKNTIWCKTEQINENLCNSVENENAPEPKINNAADDHAAVETRTQTQTQTTNLNREIYMCSIKNRSPTRERNYERSFTHSPSPSSSIGSDSSSSSGSSSRSSGNQSMRSSKSCSIDSTASFNWMPIAKDQQQQQQQLQGNLLPQCSFESATRETQSLRELNENFRNSLPDIRSVNCQENFIAQYSNDITENLDGCVLEYFSIHTKSTTQKPKVEKTSVTPGRRAAGVHIEDDPDAVGKCTCNSNERRVSSVPNDLHKLLDKSFKNNIERRRSCSWSTLSKTTKESIIEFESEKNQKANVAGYLGASYHNLTLLDYTGRQKANMNSNNLKRNTNIDRSDERVSADYESIICKGNFLLDELSQIYDRNASILNDRTVDSLLEEAEQKIALYEESLCTSSNQPTPKVPPRLKNMNSLDLPEYEEPEIVQHVSLTIRKAPERRRKTKTNSLIETAEKSSEVTGSRTFDQDPTNLRTSYAQSLEKCNFDAKEVSSTDVRTAQRSLPKRRFHSHAVHAKKKNLVSSTPNLNSFEGCDEGDVEDDIYVSSAHTSMHQLPQGGGAKAQKPLGILLPTGSRSSFGKEVSFCPVVSKYCWQEQSSEECNAPELQRQDGIDEAAPSVSENSNNERAQNEVEEEEDEEEELDDDVIFNTKENETIAVRDQLREREEEIREREQLKETQIVDKRSYTQNEVMPTAIAAVDNGTGKHEVSLKPTIVSVELEKPADAYHNNDNILTSPPQQAAVVAAVNSVRESIKAFETNNDNDDELQTAIKIENNNYNRNVDVNVDEKCVDSDIKISSNKNANIRPLSMQLPILSEPPINRAHHILYASQQLLDKRTTRELIDDLERTHDKKPYRNIKATSVNNLQEQQQFNKMSSTGQQQQQQQNKFNNNNNNNNNISNNSSNKSQKIKADEKHPRSIGFLSRFANGLRFSLRRNKKKQQQQQQQQSDIEQTTTATTTIKNGNLNKNKQNIIDIKKENKQKTPDFIYIPLKGPLPNSSSNIGNVYNYNNVDGSGGSGSSKIGAKLATTTTNNTTKIVTGKPPLPKQPPRILHQQQQQQQRLNKNLILNESAGATHAQSPANYNNEMQFLEVERLYYGRNNNNNYGAADDEYSDNTTSSADYSAFRNQLMAGVQTVNAGTPTATNNNINNNKLTTTTTTNGGNETLLSFTSPSRATVAQKTQIFQNLANKQQQQQHHQSNGRLVNSIVVRSQKHPQQQQQQYNSNATTTTIGLIETNLDTHETIISGKTRSLLDIAVDRSLNARKQRRTTLVTTNVLENDDNSDTEVDDVGDVVIKKCSNSQGTKTQIATVRRPHKSMEFLLDKENQKNVLPPENELQKSHENNPAMLSEHQLRIQASLQRLNIPDWFRQYNQKSPQNSDTANGSVPYKPGNFTRKRTTESGRWAGLNSKTTSLSSLGSQRSDRSPLLLSPSAHSHHGGQTSNAQAAQQAHVGSHNVAGYTPGHGSFSRWSTSHLSSSQTSPIASQRGSFARGNAVNSSFMSVASGNSGVIRNSFRQPYMGWRSQEKLSQRTAHERLASSLLAQQQQQQQQQQRPTTQRVSSTTGNQHKDQAITPEIQSSIKEVTSAIVHYVNDQTNPQRSRSTSPNSRKCWLESSFVGVRPLDSPQTPVIETSATATTTTTIGANTTESFENVTSTYFLNSNNFAAFDLTRPINTTASTTATTTDTGTTNVEALRINGLNICERSERSLSSASLEDVLASLLGLPATTSSTGVGASASDAYARSTTGASVREPTFSTFRPMPQAQQKITTPLPPPVTTNISSKQPQLQTLDFNTLQTGEQQQQQHLRRRSEGDKPVQQQQQQVELPINNNNNNNNNNNSTCITYDNGRRVSVGDSSESAAGKTVGNTTNNTISGAEQTSTAVQVKCRNTKCEKSTTATDAKKYYKSCHNCSHLYCSRECRRAHWEKHRKACLHSRASNLCRQALATCKDDSDSQRHLSLLARRGVLSQGRGVVRILFRSAEAAEGFIKHGFQCIGEASYVRWPDLMPAEMGLELYSELLKLATEYKPESKMLIYVAICVVSEAPGTDKTPVRWERQLVSRCAKLKLCKSIQKELDQQQLLPQQNVAVVAVPEPSSEILILTFNPSLCAHSTAQRDMILNNILQILAKRGVVLRKHYPEIYQRLQSYAEGQTDKFNSVTLHPRDTQTGQGFVCIIMPVQSDSELIRLPSTAEGGNRISCVDVGAAIVVAEGRDGNEINS